jgi:hypothetical protein
MRQRVRGESLAKVPCRKEPAGPRFGSKATREQLIGGSPEAFRWRLAGGFQVAASATGGSALNVMTNPPTVNSKEYSMRLFGA